jgi:tetratricopeptide (TPR) repeat protein
MAEAMERQRGSLDDATASQMQGIYQAVLQDDPEHIGANLGMASLLQDHHGNAEGALDHLERAAALTPSPTVHGALWRGTFAHPSLTDEAKMERVGRDVRDVVENAGDSPARWAALAGGLTGLGMDDLKHELEDRVLAGDPGSWGAEIVLDDRLTALAFTFDNELSRDPQADPELTASLKGALADFMALEKHRNPDRLFYAYWTQFHLEVDDPDADPGRLNELAAGWADRMGETSILYPEDYFAFGALALARHPGCVEEARRLLDLAWVEMERLESEAEEAAAGAEEDGDSGGDDDLDSFLEGVRFTRAFLHTAQARILAQEGNLDGAEAELARARELDPENRFAGMVLPITLHELGLILERRADLARAQGAEAEAQTLLRSADDFYQEGIRHSYSPYLGTPSANPCETALEVLYERMHGSLEGFETHLAALKDAGLEERREAILAERIDDPQPLAPFVLETLEGEEVSSESYLGKVVIINFWGTW